MATISIYKNVKDTTSQETIHLEVFLQAIQSGKWQDQVLKIRTLNDDERRVAKAALPNVTISGVFGKRIDSDCKLTSGFIAIDIDNLKSELEGYRTLLNADPYTYASFASVSGTGLCVIYKIDPQKHKEAFDGISSYLLTNYQLVVDPTGINLSRTRFVSFDPALFINESALAFKKYLKKPKQRKITNTIFVQDEFTRVINEMVQQNVSCVEDYRDWRDIAFGLADQFGEAGRPYFHTLSSISSKYEPSVCDRQYTHAVKREGRAGSKVTIATIYWFAKQAGIQVHSDRTKKIAAATSTLKQKGLDAKSIATTLQQFENITDADDIIQQAFAANTSFASGETLIDNVRMWLRHNYQLRRNLVTLKVENAGRVLDDIDLNTMFLDCKVLFDDVTFFLFSLTLQEIILRFVLCLCVIIILCV